jgi:hypothetical protein
VRADHRRLDIGVAQVLLNLPDIDAIGQEMRGERVTQRVHRHGLVDGGPRMAFSSAAVSGTLRTTGRRLPRFARGAWDTSPMSIPSTSRQRNRMAHSAWF